MWVGLGAASGLIAVAAGAFGAHYLKAQLTPEHLAVFETGARYQMYHALALVLIGVVETRISTVRVAGMAFVLGTILFSGSLYALALSGMKWFGAITPLGGASFLTGWAALAYGAFRTDLRSRDQH